MTIAAPRPSRLLRVALVALIAALSAAATVRPAAAQCTVQFCASCPLDPTCAGCNAGFFLVSNSCVDVNECATNNGGCSASPPAQCTNTPGSRTCTCPSGYGGNGITCTDVNECATNNGGCSITPPVTCSNSAGSFSCGPCPTGYTGNGTTCTDLNECATNGGGCAVNAQCANLPGSRTCTCDGGYAGDGITCTDVNECATNGGGCDPLTTCTNVPGSRTCSACPSGYSGTGDTSCTDVNECATPNVCNGGACTNGVGSFTCDCPSGVTGTTCDVNGYVPLDKDTAKCEAAVASNVAKYVKCVTRCRLQKASKALADKPFDEQECQGGTKSCRSAYDKKMASLVAAGTCPPCLDAAAQAGLANDALAAVVDTKGRAYCDGTVPLAP